LLGYEGEDHRMNRLALVLAALLALVAPAGAQDRPAAGFNREQGAPGSAGPSADGAVQHGAQPNPAEVRPGSRDGDAPSAAAGNVVERPESRIFGLPVTAALLIGAALIILVVIAGLIVPAARRGARPRGGGSY
jgi:hypothetical protein